MRQLVLVAKIHGNFTKAKVVSIVSCSYCEFTLPPERTSGLGCIPVGTTVSYQCTVMDVQGIGNTVWLGSAFDCPSENNRITLPHADYSTGAAGECGGLFAMSSNNVSGMANYISTLSFTATADMDGQLISCTLSVVMEIETDTIKTGVPPPSPELNIEFFPNSSYIISWSTPGNGSNINGSSFTVSGSECGCESVSLSSGDTSVTCSGWEANGQNCSFTVTTRSQDCSFVSEPATESIRLAVPSSPMNVRLLLPAMPFCNESVSISVQFFSVQEPLLGANLSTTVWYTVNASGVLFEDECSARSLCIFNFTTKYTNEINVSVIASNIIGSSPPTYYMECSPDDLGIVHSNLLSGLPGVINVTGGEVIVSSVAPTSVAMLRCNDGFEPESATNRTCQFNGQWSDGPLNCKSANKGLNLVTLSFEASLAVTAVFTLLLGIILGVIIGAMSVCLYYRWRLSNDHGVEPYVEMRPASGPVYEEPGDIQPEPSTDTNVAYGHVN